MPQPLTPEQLSRIRNAEKTQHVRQEEWTTAQQDHAIRKSCVEQAIKAGSADISVVAREIYDFIMEPFNKKED